MMDFFKKLIPGSSNKNDNQVTICRKSDITMKIDNFILIRTLGTGSFGRVFLAKQRNDPTAPPVAIKRLKKFVILKQKQVDHIASEKNILSSLSHPFIVNMLGAFKDSRYLYIVMEFVVGGEFFTHLRKARRFDDWACKFYAAQVVLIFEYLHSKNIIYRDLKPENMLIDKSGYLKLTDFGFAKVVPYRTYTLCGTPEYIAPEVLLNKGHGKPVDWWTLGVLIYEMEAGYPPFFADDPLDIYQKILRGRIMFPKTFNKDAKSLVKNLLSADLGKRFGNLKNGVDDIKKHRWFEGFDFAALLRKEYKDVPFKPIVKGPDDTDNFDHYPESIEPSPEVTNAADLFVGW